MKFISEKGRKTRYSEILGNVGNASAIKDLHQAQVVRKVDNATHRINHYPVDSVVCLPGFAWLSTLILYRVSDLSAGYSVIRPLNNRGQECIPQRSVSRGVYITCGVNARDFIRFGLWIAQMWSLCKWPFPSEGTFKPGVSVQPVDKLRGLEYCDQKIANCYVLWCCNGAMVGYDLCNWVAFWKNYIGILIRLFFCITKDVENNTNDNELLPGAIIGEGDRKRAPFLVLA